MFRDLILLNHGNEPSSAMHEPSLVLVLLQLFVEWGVGVGVQLRRWWTAHDAGHDLSKFWSSIAFGRCLEELEEGNDPFNRPGLTSF